MRKNNADKERVKKLLLDVKGPSLKDIFIITWDHKGQPDSAELTEAARKGCVHFRYVDDGSDVYYLIASPIAISDSCAKELIEEYYDLT